VAGGFLYIADTGNNRVRAVNLGTNQISTLAGTGVAGFLGDGGQATLARLNTPMAVAVDQCGHVLIADLNNNRIRQVDTGGMITTVAGNGFYGFGGDGGSATSAWLSHPFGVAVPGGVERRKEEAKASL